MIDANILLGRVLAGGAASGFLGGLVGGGAVGMLGSKKGRKMAKSVLKVGGIAAVGSLAYHAYNQYRRAPGQAAEAANDTAVPAGVATATAPRARSAGAELAPPPPGSGFLPDPADRAAVQSFGVTLIRAMIAAARADGDIDAAEAQRLFAEMERAGLEAEEKSFLLREFTKPVDMDTLVAEAATPERAAEVYAASLLAIEVSNQAESAYLQLLASRLKLEPALIAQLQRTVAEEALPA